MQAKDRDNRLRINDGAVGHHLHGLLLRVQAYRGTWRLRANRGTVHLLESRRQIQRGVLRGEAGRVDEARELGELRSLVAGLLAQLAACNVQILLAWRVGMACRNLQRPAMGRDAVLLDERNLPVSGHRKDADGVPVVLMQDEPFELADLRRTERDPVHVEIMGLDDLLAGLLLDRCRTPRIEGSVSVTVHAHKPHL